MLKFDFKMDISGVLFGTLATTFVIGISTFLLLLWYSIKKQSYWKERNIPYVKSLPFIGSLFDTFVTHIHVLEHTRYFSLGPIYGHYEGNNPLLSLADPQLLRDIFVKDFAFFSNRRSFATGDKISDKMLSILEGEDWKRVRTIITPTFSTGKLKRVLGIFKDCSRTLVQNFKTSSANSEQVDIKRLFGAFTMDVIASSAFSTKLDSFNDPDNEFVKRARQAFGYRINWRILLLIFAPRIMKLFKISPSNPTVNNFFKNVTTEIIEERKRTKQRRNDFLQLLLDTAEETSKNEKKDDIDNEDDEIADNYGKEVAAQKVFNTSSLKNLTMDELVAQCVIFFIAGYETTANTLTYILYELATNADVQEKARQEMTQVLEDTNGELTYEALQSMKYLDNIISESLRMFPPAVRAERKCEREYKLGDTGITLEKDMIVTIPIYALHHDPKYYPNPEKFDPDRFTGEEKGKRDSYVYLPFGAGPRNCVGMRFALLEIKVCLAHVISNFNIKACHKTPIPMKFNFNSFGILQPKDVYISFESREDCILTS